MLEVSLDTRRHEPGDFVRGRVTITETTKARRLLVALRRVEKSPDYTIPAATVEAPPLATGDLQAGDEYEFAIGLPDDALPGVRSANGRIYWEVDAWIDKSWRDPHATAELDVVQPPGSSPS